MVNDNTEKEGEASSALPDNSGDEVPQAEVPQAEVLQAEVLAQLTKEVHANPGHLSEPVVLLETDHISPQKSSGTSEHLALHGDKEVVDLSQTCDSPSTVRSSPVPHASPLTLASPVPPASPYSPLLFSPHSSPVPSPSPPPALSLPSHFSTRSHSMSSQSAIVVSSSDSDVSTGNQSQPVRGTEGVCRKSGPGKGVFSSKLSLKLTKVNRDLVRVSSSSAEADVVEEGAPAVHQRYSPASTPVPVTLLDNVSPPPSSLSLAKSSSEQGTSKENKENRSLWVACDGTDKNPLQRVLSSVKVPGSSGNKLRQHMLATGVIDLTTLDNESE